MKTARVFVYDIEYETDGVSVEFLRSEGCFLPAELWLDVEIESVTDESLHEIADAISDCTGWCVNTFQFRAYAA